MKKFPKTSFLLLCGFVLWLSAASVFAAKLAVHHIGVGQGDATLFVMTYDNGYQFRVLIDAGNSAGKGEGVWKYLNDSLASTGKYLNYIIISHLHSDHYGGMPALIKRLGDDGWKVGYFIDRGASLTVAPGELCSDDTGPDFDNDPVQMENAEPNTTLYKQYEAAIKKYYDEKRINPRPGVDLVSSLFSGGKNPGPFYFYCVGSNGCWLNKYGTAEHECLGGTPTENDLSYSWMVNFAGYAYFSGGDIAGENDGGYQDLETPLCKYFATFPDASDFHYCTLKVSHHGSAHSTNALWVQKGCANPTMSVIPSALRSFSGTQIPTQSTIDRLRGIGSIMKYTYIKTDGVFSAGKVTIYNNVIVTLTDPGYGKTIRWTTAQQKVDKPTIVPYGDILTSSMSCTKSHPDRKLGNLTGSGLLLSLAAADGRTKRLQGKVADALLQTATVKPQSLRRYGRFLQRLEATDLPVESIYHVSEPAQD